ncbi:MAG: prefoldin subunit beta [Candidatus Heimdallarchaeota archaeon]|nr:prefoldin subunit beta [Candidatus Heimdallarchaeota archaeon]
MSQGISPQLEEKIKQYQNIQQKMGAVQQQIQQLKIDQIEIEKALKEIEEMPDDETCYRSIGRLMVKSSIKETKAKLADQKELSETRIKLSEKSYEKLKTQFEDLEENIKAALNTTSK